MKAKGRRGHSLERWEVSLVKAMLARGDCTDQDILAYFTRPSRSVNHRLIAQIRQETIHKATKTATADELAEFLATWPDVDPQTGLSMRGDELLLKAREAMIAAVHTFNGAGLHFRAELFIVTAIISWTYLHHAYFKREGVDYRHYRKVDGVTQVAVTENGAERFWELGYCLKHARCPLKKAIKDNLEFLIEIRNEIEHRSTSRIDDVIGSHLQACCLNFNEAIKTLFGAQYGLERRLPIALQFMTFSSDQRAVLKRASSLPRNIQTMMDAFSEKLTPEEQADPNFSYLVNFSPVLANRPGGADEVIEFTKASPDVDERRSRVFVKEVDRKTYRAGQVVEQIQKDGYAAFSIKNHTDLWRLLKARDPKAGFGTHLFGGKEWGWHEKWISRVREYCKEHEPRFGSGLA